MPGIPYALPIDLGQVPGALAWILLLALLGVVLTGRRDART